MRILVEDDASISAFGSRGVGEAGFAVDTALARVHALIQGTEEPVELTYGDLSLNRLTRRVARGSRRSSFARATSRCSSCGSEIRNVSCRKP